MVVTTAKPDTSGKLTWRNLWQRFPSLRGYALISPVVGFDGGGFDIPFYTFSRA